MYFGDYESYKKSPLKIITVGLNPSHEEFPDDDPFKRFKDTEKIYKKDTLSKSEKNQYLNSLNTYFDNEPYKKYFNKFEPILNAMNTSFYAGYQNIALHTDLCSPLATKVTWSNYEKKTPRILVNDILTKGCELWHKIVKILQPNVILVSIRDEYKRLIFRDSNLEWNIIEVFTKTTKGFDRATPYKVQASLTEFRDDEDCLIVYGSNNRVPFMISNFQKRALGKKIYRLFDTEKGSSPIDIVKKSDKQLFSEFIALCNQAKKENLITAREWRGYVKSYRENPLNREKLTEKIKSILESLQSNT
jgi:hypothetical protein